MGNPQPSESKYTDADHGLDPAQFASLNAEFYSGFHAELINTRLALLCVMHETPDIVEALLEGGVSWGKLKMQPDPAEGSRESLQRNAELELVALRQHVAEVLFRVVWVHGHQEPCPWLGLARLRRPGDLQEAARAYLSGELWESEAARHLWHAKAIWGPFALDTERNIQSPIVESLGAVEEWLLRAVELILDASLYNAYKHGLAVVASEPFTIALMSDESRGLPGWQLSAPRGFKYLDRRTDADERRHYWEKAHESINFEAAVGETAIFGLLLGTVMEAGACQRHVIPMSGSLSVLPSEVTPAMVNEIDASDPVTIQRLAEQLVYLA